MSYNWLLVYSFWCLIYVKNVLDRQTCRKMVLYQLTETEVYILTCNCHMFHLNSEQTFRWKWRTWQNASGQYWWQRREWKSTATTRRCMLTYSTVWPSLTRARQNSAKHGLSPWLAIMSTMATIQKWVHWFSHNCNFAVSTVVYFLCGRWAYIFRESLALMTSFRRISSNCSQIKSIFPVVTLMQSICVYYYVFVFL